jgi:transcriptional regulator with XRE-family HTH domain
VLSSKKITNTSKKSTKGVAMKIEDLGPLVLKRRGGMGVRAAATEIGISPTTLTRIEKGNIPDVGTLKKVCDWLGENATQFNGIGNLQIAFKSKKSVPHSTALSLAALIEKASEQFSKHVESQAH